MILNDTRHNYTGTEVYCTRGLRQSCTGCRPGGKQKRLICLLQRCGCLHWQRLMVKVVKGVPEPICLCPHICVYLQWADCQMNHCCFPPTFLALVIGLHCATFLSHDMIAEHQCAIKIASQMQRGNATTYPTSTMGRCRCWYHLPL